jgi:S-disulfanyl-L-cysteine oxidoreductase SoxD
MKFQATHHLVFAFAALVWVIASAVASGQGAAARTTWDGVFSKDQARRGEEAANEHCVKCHGDGLAGKEMSPGLEGPEFFNSWEGTSVADFYTRVRETMPLDAPNSLSASTARDVVAYILQLNAFPDGATDLPASVAELNTIRMTSQRP